MLLLPPLEELLRNAVAIELPLQKRFRGLTQRHLILFEGPSGWGEFAPFSDHDLRHAARWLQGAIEAAYVGFPDAVRDRVAINGVVPMLDAPGAAAWVRQLYARDGVSTFKIKCGAADFSDDMARVSSVVFAVRDLGIADAKIRIDVNGSWSPVEAAHNINVLNDVAHGLEYVEQPARSLEDCALIKSQISTPIAIDEGIRLNSDPLADRDLIRAAGDVAVLKSIPLGGVARSLEIAAGLGMPTVVSGSLDSSVGLDSGLALAAALPELAFACGLGTGSLLAADVVPEIRRPIDGMMKVERIAPARVLLDAASERMPVTAREELRERMCATYELLEQM